MIFPFFEIFVKFPTLFPVEIGKSHKIYFPATTQYFVAGRSIKSKTNYLLRYENTKIDSRSYEINYDEELTIIESSLGVRFFNYQKSMMSELSINYRAFEVDKLNVEASQGTKKYALSQLGETERENLSLRIGFGILF